MFPKSPSGSMFFDPAAVLVTCRMPGGRALPHCVFTFTETANGLVQQRIVLNAACAAPHKKHTYPQTVAQALRFSRLCAESCNHPCAGTTAFAYERRMQRLPQWTTKQIVLCPLMRLAQFGALKCASVEHALVAVLGHVQKLGGGALGGKSA
jgi:hypothetical protein